MDKTTTHTSDDAHGGATELADDDTVPPLEESTEPEDGRELATTTLDRDELFDDDTIPPLEESSTDPEHGKELEANRRIPPSTDVSDVRSLIGPVIFYRRHVEKVTQSEHLNESEEVFMKPDDGKDLDSDALLQGLLKSIHSPVSIQPEDGKDLDSDALLQGLLKSIHSPVKAREFEPDEFVDNDTMPPLEEVSSESDDGEELDDVLTQSEDVKELDEVPTEAEDGRLLGFRHGSFQCGYCGDEYNSEMNLVRHQDANAHHYCFKCGMSCRTRRQFVQHLRDSEIHNFCSECAVDFPSPRALQVHFQSHSHHGSVYLAFINMMCSLVVSRVAVLLVLLGILVTYLWRPLQE